MKYQQLASLGTPRNELLKTGLQVLLRLLLLIRPKTECWRDALFVPESHQRSNHVHYVDLDADANEASQVFKYVAGLVTSQFRGGKDCISWNDFEAWSSAHVSVLVNLHTGS